MPTARFQPRTKPLFPAVLGSLMLLVGAWMFQLVLRGELSRTSLPLTTAFLLAGGWILSIAIRRPPVFRISEDMFISGKLRIPLDAIEIAKVRRVRVDGGSSRLLELRLREKLIVPFSWRAAHWFDRRTFRASLAGDVYRLPPEPYLLIPLVETDRSDREIEMALGRLGKERDRDRAPEIAPREDA